MKLAVILPLVFETALCAPGTLGIDIYRARKTPGGRDTRGNMRAYERFQAARDGGAELVPESLTNGFYAYFANMTIGSNAQPVNPMIDTGSSDLWVTSEENPYCTQDPNGFKGSGEQWDCTGFIFDPSTSTTYRNLSDPFHISYVDTTGAYGWLSQDTVTIGGAAIPNTTFAYATTANSSDSVFGVGYAANEATTRFSRNGTVTGEYKNIPILLKEDGYINTVAYSLYLNDPHAQYGQVLFGGVDHAKYHGPLGLMPLVNTYYPQINQTIEFMVRVSGMGVRTGDNVCPLADFVVPALLDSGTSYAVLPSDLIDAMGKQMNYTWPSLPNATWWQGPCSPSTFDFDSFELDFLGLKLQVPPASLLDTLQDEDGEYVKDGNGNQICMLAVQKAGPDDDYVLGDVFQRNWYVVYDLDNYQVALAQSNLNDTSASNVEPIVSTIPGATSVKNYNLAGFQYTVSTHNVAGSCLAQATSKPLSASKSAVPSSSVRASASSSAGAPSSAVAASSSVRSVAAAATSAAVASSSPASSSSAIPSSSASPSSTASPVTSQFASSSAAGSALAANRVPSSDPGSPKYVTTVVSSFVTTCPMPTTFATNGQIYTVTDSTVLTITDCPCTLTHAASATPSESSAPASASSTSTSASAASAEASTTVVSTFVTTCSTPTTFATNGKTYTVTESTVLTITDCPCTLSHTASAPASEAPVPSSEAPTASSSGLASTEAATPSTEAAASSASSTEAAATPSTEAAASSSGAASSATPKAPAEAATASSAAAVAASTPAATSAASASASLPPSLAPESSAPVLANSANRVGAALSAAVGALAVLLI